MFSLQEESAALAATAHINWHALENKRVLITGVTGLIGSHCARFLLEHNRAFDSNITVVALVRSVDKAQRMLAGYCTEDGLEYVQGDLLTASEEALRADYIIHAACPTASNFFAEHPAQTADSIVLGTRRMLELAHTETVEGFVYVSSMEVYGQGNASAGVKHALDEHSTGITDPLSTRSCYPEGKRMAEQYCVAYAAEYGVNAKVIRLAQTFGPGIAKDDARIFAMFARNARAGKDVVLKTTGESTRMYLYTTDAVRAIFTVLLEGNAGAAYNAANPTTYSSVIEMARFVMQRYGTGTAEVRIEIDPSAPYPPEHHLPLDVSALESLGWHAEVSLEEMYSRLIAYLED